MLAANRTLPEWLLKCDNRPGQDPPSEHPVGWAGSLCVVSGLGSRVEISSLHRTLWDKASPEAEGGGGACVGKLYVLRLVHIIRTFRWSQICSECHDCLSRVYRI